MGQASVWRQVSFSLAQAAEGKALAEQLALDGLLADVVEDVRKRASCASCEWTNVPCLQSG